MLLEIPNLTIDKNCEKILGKCLTESEMPDCAQTKEERMTLNLNEIHQLMNKPKDTLIGIIKDNRESLEHNRKLLFECKSIENI